MAALQELKDALMEEINVASKALIPFDRVFDEDTLHAKNEQLIIIKDEIDRLEMQLMSLVINNNAGLYTDTEQYSVLADKMSLFHEKENEVLNEIQTMTQARDQLYDEWKNEYMDKADKFTKAQTKLKKLLDIEETLLKLSKKGIKANNNILLFVYIHSQVNALLNLADIKKERSPYKAFEVAWHHGLIDDETYKALGQ